MKAVKQRSKYRSRFHIPIQVRFRDVDSMGHVNHAVYFSYLEMARCEYWLALLKRRHVHELGIIVVHAECDYHSPAEYGEWLDVYVGISELRNSSFVMEYEILARHPRRPVVKGRTIQAIYDYSKRQTEPISPLLRRKIEAFERHSFPLVRN